MGGSVLVGNVDFMVTTGVTGVGPAASTVSGPATPSVARTISAPVTLKATPDGEVVPLVTKESPLVVSVNSALTTAPVSASGTGPSTAGVTSSSALSSGVTVVTVPSHVSSGAVHHATRCDAHGVSVSGSLFLLLVRLLAVLG